jgi:parvulin-like peptidyl-prolyl isomerase
MVGKAFQLKRQEYMTEQMVQIGNKEIRVEEVLSCLNRYQLMPQVLRGMVVDQAIAPFYCTEEERFAAILRFETQHQLTSDVTKNDWLENHSLTQAEMEELAIRLVLIDKFKIANWGNKLESYFLKRKSSFDQVIYSLIRTKDPGLAQELYFRICESEQSFAELAQKYSQGTEVHTGGLLGPVSLNQPHPAIRQMLCVSQPGQLWSPRKVGEWFLIIRLEKLLPAQLDESMRQRLLSELFESWIQEQIKTKIQQSKSNNVLEDLAA